MNVAKNKIFQVEKCLKNIQWPFSVQTATISNKQSKTNDTTNYKDNSRESNGGTIGSIDSSYEIQNNATDQQQSSPVADFGSIRNLVSLYLWIP